MPLVELKFNAAGEEQWARSLELYDHELQDMSDPLGEIGDDLIDTIAEQFETEGGRTGTRWHSLSRAYDRWKELHWPSRPILVASGAMQAAALDPYAVHVTSNRMVYEVDDEKAIWHQKGAGAMPQRKIVNLGLADRRRWERYFAHWVNSLRRGPMRHSGR